MAHGSWLFIFSRFSSIIWVCFLSKLRQLLLESQSQLDAAKSEAQKQSSELALVSEWGWVGAACEVAVPPMALHPQR